MLQIGGAEGIPTSEGPRASNPGNHQVGNRLGSVSEIMLKICSPIRASRQPAGTRPGSRFRLVALAVLLAQLQLFWLAGFHYHPEVPGPQRSGSNLVSAPSGQGTPADNSQSCPFCRIARHSPSAPPTTVFLSFHNISTGGIVPLVSARPIAAPQVRFTGRDPPFSWLANC